MKLKLLALLFFTAAIAIPAARAAHADDLTVTPAVIDAHGLPRDILSYTLTVTNNTNVQQIVFASVNELTADGKQAFLDPSVSNRPETLADWISVDRGSMTFQPGETKTLPVGININPSATQGDYHAVIEFVEGATRDQAEQHLDGAPQAIINVSVASDATELLQIDSFTATKYFNSSFPADFNYTIENTGDVPSTPIGQVLFYDRTGHEIGSVNANPSSTSIVPGTTALFTATWAKGPGLGQYKAVLDLTYGANDATLESVALFWILPWMKLLIVFGLLFILVIVGAIFLHREYEKRHHRRQQFIENLLKRPPVPLVPPRPPMPPMPPRTPVVVDLRGPKKHHD